MVPFRNLGRDGFPPVLLKYNEVTFPARLRILQVVCDFGVLYLFHDSYPLNGNAPRNNLDIFFSLLTRLDIVIK